jgi:hypothetical protein
VRTGDHAAARRAAERAGVYGKPCARCGKPILPGQLWDLDHVDVPWADGGGGRREPSQRRCNRSAGGRLGRARQRAERRRKTMMSMISVWPAAGVEVAVDRSQTWVARAARHGERVVVELLDPVPGTTAVVALLSGWRAGWQIEQVGVDPRSPSATLVEPLRDAGLPVKAADAHGVAVAHGTFLDLLAGGVLRVRGHRALDEAARLAAERRVAGAHAVDRYAGTNQAPLFAAELAIWALVSAPVWPPADVF